MLLPAPVWFIDTIQWGVYLEGMSQESPDSAEKVERLYKKMPKAMQHELQEGSLECLVLFGVHMTDHIVLATLDLSTRAVVRVYDSLKNSSAHPMIAADIERYFDFVSLPA